MKKRIVSLCCLLALLNVKNAEAKEIICQTTERNGGKDGYEIVRQSSNTNDKARDVYTLWCDQPGKNKCEWEGGKSPCQGKAYQSNPVPDDIVIIDDFGQVLPITGAAINQLIIDSINVKKMRGDFMIDSMARVLYSMRIDQKGVRVLEVKILTGDSINLQ